MAKLNIPSGGGGKRKQTIVKLKLVVEMLQKTVLSGSKKSHDNNQASSPSFFEDDDDDDEEEEDVKVTGGGRVPADVKEGHFVVFAATGEGEAKRFVVPLSYLEYPPFMRLLKEAEEEYGFGREGVLTVPCHPDELERLLSSHQLQQNRRRASGSFMLNTRLTKWVDLSTYSPVY
ncbi:uncharacterized protein LOC124916643 [Impatiens glandulifera]|uniref:uncharacterized protein LOC124916643 n=1 Tax=Impatiens glandulifera TaxID=253017 RepID=UPI001FB0A755|nr:uncharacterized protein LOC124916643 [Impatiens glandulifera]